MAVQQEYAGASRFLQRTSVAGLIEDAIRVNSLDRRVVRVVRELEPVPRLSLDEHKLLQILINLISNAKHALEAAE